MVGFDIGSKLLEIWNEDDEKVKKDPRITQTLYKGGEKFYKRGPFFYDELDRKRYPFRKK